jgi:hypothetical protein
MRSNQPDELDRLLDELLASYSSEEPRPGLEQRVLGRVRAESTPRRFDWWRWAVAVPVFAALLLLTITHRVKPQAPSVERNLASVEAPAITDLALAQPRHAPRRIRRVGNPPVVARAPLPRRAVFPLPVPLSAEERAVLDLATRFPDQARQVLIEADERSRQPIEIQRIEIPLLPGGIQP